MSAEPPRDEDFAAYLAARLSEVPGVTAVTLGGSRWHGDHGPDADWDVAIYYRDHFEVDDLRRLAWPGEIYPIGGWGGGVFNGGAHLDVHGRRVDVHYRDLTDLEHRIDEAARGRFDIEHLAFHLAGVPTYIVIAELALGRVLCGDLPRPDYPEALKENASRRWRQHADSTLDYAEKAYAAKGDVIGTAGAMARAVVEASHARLAERGAWVTNENRLVRQAGLQDAVHWFMHLEPLPDRLREAVDGVRQSIRR